MKEDVLISTSFSFERFGPLRSFLESENFTATQLKRLVLGLVKAIITLILK